MLASFYRPNGKRTKILMESAAFPSDQYALETHVRFRGLVPEQELIEVQQDPDTFFVGTDKVLDLIAKHENELALVYLAGVQYLNGEVLDMERITRVCREKGIMIGWELAHALGNVDLDLHSWSPDFAIWCNYKYGNGGPGTLGGLFVPSRHWGPETLRLAGWWGYKPDTRFKMQKGFIPAVGADSWALSNPPILSLAPLKASLPMFEQAGWANLRVKSKALLQKVRDSLAALPEWEILTPNDPASGNMLVIKHPQGRAYYNRLMEEGVILDWREPGVIRFALCPLYNTTEDADKLLNILQIK
jgi:kynureninase